MEPKDQIQYTAKFYSKKACTKFTWQLEDYALLEKFYGKFRLSNNFKLATTNELCTLGFMHKVCGTASTFLFLPIGLKFHTIGVNCSIIDGFEKKIISKSRVLPFDDFIQLPVYNKSYYQIQFDLMKKNELLTKPGCLVNDTLNLLFEITVVSSVYESAQNVVKSVHESAQNTIVSFKEESGLLNKLNEYFTNKSFCDVTFFVDETAVYAHKVILAANSPVFETMFRTKMIESTECNVTIKDMDLETFKTLVRCMYTGNIDKIEKQPGKLMIAADKYQVSSIIKQCESYIVGQLNASNVIEYLLLAHNYGFVSLKKRALAVAVTCVKGLSSHSEFGRLCQYPELVGEIFQTK